MYEEEVVTTEDPLSLSERCEQQRLTIGVMAEALSDVGFDLGDFADCAESETQRPPPKRGPSWWFSRVACAYMALGLLSVNAPGPLSGFGAARHVRLFLHLDHAADAYAHVITRLL